MRPISQIQRAIRSRGLEHAMSKKSRESKHKKSKLVQPDTAMAFEFKPECINAGVWRADTAHESSKETP